MNIPQIQGRMIASIVVLLGLFLLPLFIRAEESPLDLIRARNQKIKQMLDAAGDSVDAPTREKLKDIINGLIDFRELSRRALGKYWDERSEKERQEFVDVFRKLIRNSSVKKLEIYRADRIQYSDPAMEGDEATVTTVAFKGKKSAEIVYNLHLVNGEWKVYDIVIDGLSTARSYRDSFYKQIAKSSYREMYEKLVKRLGEE